MPAPAYAVCVILVWCSFFMITTWHYYRVAVIYRHYCFCKCWIYGLDYCKCKPRTLDLRKVKSFFALQRKSIHLPENIVWPRCTLSLNTLTSLSLVDSFKLMYECVPHNISTLAECCSCLFTYGVNTLPIHSLKVLTALAS